jgi:PGF-CTERM protein
VDGKPIYYYVDQQGGQIPTDAGYVGVVNSTNIIVRDLNLTKNLQGILFVNTSDSTIENVTASNNMVGIMLEHSSNDNTLSSNTASGNEVGIWLSIGIEGGMVEGANNTTSNNFGRRSPVSSNDTLTDNGAPDKEYGIMLDAGGEMAEGANNNTLTGNDASNNWVGIYLVCSSNNTLTSNNAPGNGVGIWLEYSSNNTLTSNNASGNGEVGIALVDSSNNNTLTSNTASNNWVGIYIIEESNNNTLTGNIANSNIAAPVLPANGGPPGSGIWLGYSSNNTLTSNTASNNGCGIVLGAGMIAPDSASNTTTSNNFGRMSPVSSNNTLADNDASDKGYGIVPGAVMEMVESTSNNTLTGNDASGNEIGILLAYSSNNTLTGNTASGNGVGIWLEYSSNNTLTGNTASGNYVGILLADSSNNNTLSSNTALDNSDWDIYIDNSPSNTFADNTLNGTTVSFTYSGDVSLRGVGLPAAGEPGWYSIGKFIDVTNQSEGAWMILNFSYSDSDFTGAMDESNLMVWKYNGTWYEDGWNGTRYSDPANNTVGVNITSFSVFAPMTTGVPALDHINVEPGSALLNIDKPPKSQTFAATGRSKHTDPIPDLMFGWSNTDTSVGWLNNSTGTVVNFTAERVGRAYLTASNGSVTSDQVPVTVDAIADNTTVDDEKIFTATSGDATVTGTFSSNLTGWINITAIGNATNSSEVNSSNPRYGLGSGDRVVSGVIVTVCGNISNELGENGTIHIEICYNTTTLAALGIDASTLAIWKYNSTTEKWVKQSSTISGTCVYIDVDHLCTFGLVGSKATPSGGSSTGGGGGGTYPPGWFGTPTPAVTATKAPAATTTATAAPPGERVTPAPTKVKSAAAKAAAPAAEGTTAETAKKGLPGFTAIFAIAGMLAVAYAMMRRRG